VIGKKHANFKKSCLEVGFRKDEIGRKETCPSYGALQLQRVF
jgi:hypothetical protein